MTAAVAIRPDLDLTLSTLHSQLAEQRRESNSTDISLDRISLDVTAADPHIRLGDTLVPVSETGLIALADHLDVPTPFFKRIGKNVGMDLQARILTDLMSNAKNDTVRVTYTESGGITEIGAAGRERIAPVRLVEVAGRVLGDSAPVQRLVSDSAEFGFDAHVALNSERGVGGDRTAEIEIPEEVLRQSWVTHSGVTSSSRVGDITTGGLRFGLDLKRGLAPTVQPWVMRLACTNGMEMTDMGSKVDARGMTVDEVLAEIEALAQQAFSGVESQIEAFYDLRNTRVENPERALIRMAEERDIPPRSLRALLDTAPALEAPTMFDLTNMVTNLANHRSIRNNGGRLLLERAGGATVTDHHARCSHCQHALN